MEFRTNIILQLNGHQGYEIFATKTPNLLFKSTTSLTFLICLGLRGNFVCCIFFEINIRLLTTWLHIRVFRKYTYLSIIMFVTLIFIFLDWDYIIFFTFRRKITFVNVRMEVFGYELSNNTFIQSDDLSGNILLASFLILRLTIIF